MLFTHLLMVARTKIAHLQMIQAVITRLAGNSFMVKRWSLTLVVALLALAAGVYRSFCNLRKVS